MRRKMFVMIVAALAVIAPLAPAQAITNGQPDGNGHPFVGQLLFYDPTDPDPRFTDGGSWFTCSGTLVDDTHVVTAGHCTYGTGTDGDETPGGSGGTDVWISFAEKPLDVVPPSTDFCEHPDDPDVPCNGDNTERYDAWEAALDASGEWHRATAIPSTHYDPSAFYLNDVGVLELDDSVTKAVYGQLPAEGLIDDLYGASKSATYTTVGYGLTKTLPSIPDEGGDARNVATVKINNLNGVWGTPRGVAVAFSSNNGRPHQGGTCFGDSGGPTFPNVEGETTTIITVTSFAIDQNCRAGGGGYRLDQEDDLTWLASVLAPTAAP